MAILAKPKQVADFMTEAAASFGSEKTARASRLPGNFTHSTIKETSLEYQKLRDFGRSAHLLRDGLSDGR